MHKAFTQGFQSFHKVEGKAVPAQSDEHIQRKPPRAEALLENTQACSASDEMKPHTFLSKPMDAAPEEFPAGEI